MVAIARAVPRLELTRAVVLRMVQVRAAVQEQHQQAQAMADSAAQVARECKAALVVSRLLVRECRALLAVSRLQAKVDYGRFLLEK